MEGLNDFKGTIVKRSEKEFFKHAYQYASSSSAPGEMEPAFIAYPSSENADNDVLALVRYAKEKKISIAVRTGGHQYSGASSTSGDNLQLNLSKCYRDFDFNKEIDVITMGVSYPLKEFNNTLCSIGRFIPHGQCTHVHIGGHAQTGGYGLLGRSFGLFADYILKIRIITADEKIREIERDDEEGIFWAFIGGSPGNLGILTHVTVKTMKDSDHPHSRGLKLFYHYNEHHTQNVIKILMEMAADPDFDEDYDVFIIMFSETILKRTFLRPFAKLKTLDEKMRKQHHDYYGTSERAFWPRAIAVQAMWANTKGPGQVYDPKFFHRLKAAAHHNVKSFRPEDHVDGEMPISHLMREFLFPNVREFETPYVKRCYFPKQVPDERFPEWVTRRIREGHAAGYKMALQIQPFGGKKGKFYLNGLENKTALSWRDSTFLVCLDTFGLDVTQMQKFQEETDKELIGSEGALLGNEDRRLIWGSHDKDLPANHQYYYESKEMYDRLCEIKKKIDPDNVFTPNRFCVGVPE